MAEVHKENTLKYHSPALDWESQALPIGNGRLGAMILGPVERSHLQFNVDSLWTGGKNPTGGYDAVHFGNYQAFGNLLIELDNVTQTAHYARELDIASAVHTTSFVLSDGSSGRQTVFASHPAELVVVRLAIDGQTKLDGRVRLVGEHAENTLVSSNELGFFGALNNGLRYGARVTLLPEDCEKTSPAEASLSFAGCRSLTLLLAAATNYAADSEAGYRGSDPEPKLAAWLDKGRRLGFERLLAEHVADHQRLFSRVSVDFGQSEEQVRSLPLDERIFTYAPRRDPELAALLFQYGRYLLIASSRENGLPANLQGLWNHENEPPWHSDYHTNINIQMNYWLSGPANLSECQEPLFTLLDAMLPDCRQATRAAFGQKVPGFTYRTSHNIFGGQGWEWNTTSNAWYAMHYYEHYAFTGDREFLRDKAWPYLREVSSFWLHRLKRRQSDGRLVAPDGWSPEHGPREDGVSYDQQLIWQLFTDTLEAGRALELSDPILERVFEARDRLLGPQIGSWGQLQEWVEDRDDPQDQHRHTSHLIAVYPGRQINLRQTPKLAKAAEVSLRARGDTGDSRRSWTWPWRCALWARLGTPDCHRMIDGLIEHNLLKNLIATHPPLQLDGNFGITAGIAEMLLQSHAGELQLLAGVDYERWPSGSFEGLRARGGFEVSARWQGKRLVGASLLSTRGGNVTLRSRPLPSRVVDATSSRVHSRSAGETLSFETNVGASYRLIFE